MKRYGLARSVITAAFVAAAFAPAAQAAGSFSNFYVFGDSLSDVGAEAGISVGGITLPPGNHWTYDNAPLWDQLLAQQYGLTLTPNNANNTANVPAGGNDYAQGGAVATGAGDAGAIPGLGDSAATQLGSYLAQSGGKADPNAMYGVWIGGNDVAAALAIEQAAGQAAATNYLTTAAGTAAGLVSTLQSAGAQHIVVLNVPNVGATPRLFNAVIEGAGAQVLAAANAGLGNTAASISGAVAGTLATELGQGTNTALIQTLAAAVTPDTLTAMTSATANNPSINAALIAAQQQLNAGTGPSSQAVYQAAVRAAASQLASSYGNEVANAAVPVALGEMLYVLESQGAITPAQAAQLYGFLAPLLTSGIASQTTTTVYGEIPLATINAQYGIAASGATGAAQYFNQLESSLLPKGSIQINTYQLMTEIFANPGLYGFDNVTGYACPAGEPADLCTSSDPGFDNSKRFFFSDEFHPSPQATSGIEQYVYSVLQAPYFAAQLPNAQQTSVYAAQGALDNRDMHARSVGQINGIAQVSHLENNFDAGTTYLASDNNNTAVTAGVDGQMSDHTSMGLAATQVMSHTNFGSSMGSFSTSDYLMTLFSRYANGPWALSGDVSVGSTRFSNVDRMVTIGADNRTEAASTSGNQADIRVIGSYGLSMGRVTFAPTLSGNYREAKVGGYAERCLDAVNCPAQTGQTYTPTSTDMQYNQQLVDSLLFGGGVKVDGDFGRIHPFGSVMYYRDSEGKNRTITAGLVSDGVGATGSQYSGTLFDTTVVKPDHNYTVLNLGARFDLGKVVTGYLNYSYTGGLSDQHRDVWGAGLEARF